MPKVPTLEQNRIKEQGLSITKRSPRAGLASFGGGQAAAGVTAATRQLSNTVNKIEQEEIQKADQVALLDADQRLSAAETRMLYDPDTGAMNRRGKDSFTLQDEVVPEFDKLAGEIENELSNDYQKESFRKMIASRKKHIDKQVQMHVSRESQKYDQEITKSYVANEMNAAIESFHDPERIELAVQRQRGAIMSHADRTGLDAETTKLLVTETQSKTHSAVINKILNGGADQQAREYYKKNKDMIVGADRVNIEKALEQGALMGDSQRKADLIVSKSDNLGDALDQARSIKDPKMRDETRRRVKQQFADRELAKREAQDKNYQDAFDIVNANGSYDAVPRSVLSNMSASQKQNLANWADKLRKGEPATTDLNTFYDLELMAGNPATRKKFLQTNLLDHRNKLSDTDFKRFAKMQADAKKSGSSKELDGIETKNSIINGALAEADIDVGRSASSSEIKQANLFRREVDKLVVERQDASGKKITNEELRQITSNLMVEVISDKGFFFDTKKKVFELTRDDTALVRFDDVPEDEVNAIRRTLNSRNIPATDDNILKMYTEKLNQLRGPNG